MRHSITSRFVSSATVFSIACTSAAGVLACSGAPDAAREGEASTSAATISVTEVGRNADGSPKVTHRFITREAQLAMADAREGKAPAASSVTNHGEVGQTSEAWSTDSTTCSNGASQWLYDGPGNTGNMLCLLPESTSSQTADLSLYSRDVSICTMRGGCFTITMSWSGAVRSYWNPSSSAASLFTAAWFQGADGCHTYFNADGASLDADACVSKARYLVAGQETLKRVGAELNVVEVDGSYYTPGSTVTVTWFKGSSSTLVRTATSVVDNNGTFFDAALASCVGYGCGCTASAQVTDAAGRVTTIRLPDCLN